MDGICGRELRMLWQIDPEPIDWLWEPYLACGTLALLSGEAGSGTTFLALALASAVTRRMQQDQPSLSSVAPPPQEELPPPETSNENPETAPWTPSVAPGRVLYFSLENYAGRVVRPRMQALNAASDHTVDHAADHMMVGAGYWQLDDFALEVRRLRPQLVILDTLQTFARIWRRQDWLDELRRLAAECNCCILLVRHINRARSGRVPARRLGNLDLSSAVASELLVGIDGAAQSPRRRMLQLRSALAPLGTPIGFEITAENGFRWLGPAEDGEAGLAELIAAPRAPSEPSAFERAVEFLNAALACGPMEYERVQQLARSAAISKATLQRAKAELHVVCRKLSGTGHWIWALPNADVTPLDPDKGLEMDPEMVACHRSPVVASEGDNPPHQTHDDANENNVADDANDNNDNNDNNDAQDEMVEKDELVHVRLAEPVAAELGHGTGDPALVTLSEMVEKDDFQPPTALPPPAVLASSYADNADLRSPP
jgi:hypothetical protein